MLYIISVFQDNPEAKLEDLDKPGVDDEPQQVLLRFVPGNTEPISQASAFLLQVARQASMKWA